jgi:competence CoiA-like predicted nuclease
MIWALKDNKRIKANPKSKAICPICDCEVFSKCGEVNVWHWAHKNKEECDSFGEPETEWHKKWKDFFSDEYQEVKIGNHRADIKNKYGKIIELQNSSISSKEINEREKFYGSSMIWIINKETLAKNIIISDRNSKYYYWGYCPKCWRNSNNKIFIDCGNFLYLLLDNPKKRGQGLKLDKNAFIIENGGNPFKNGKYKSTKL